MLTALEFINVEQLHKKNFALLAFHLSSAIPDHILNRIGITVIIRLVVTSPGRALNYSATTFEACGPFGPCSTVN